MSDRTVPNEARTRHHGFVPAEQFVRQMPLTASLADFGVRHAEESKRPVRCIADMLGVTAVGRNRLNPLLRKRQTMEAI